MAILVFQIWFHFGNFVLFGMHAETFTTTQSTALYSTLACLFVMWKIVNYQYFFDLSLQQKC